MSKTYYGEEASGLRYPPLNDLIAKAQNKYELCIATAKRAREIVAGKEPLVEVKVDNPISIATAEIDQDEVKIISHSAPQTAEEEQAQTEDLFAKAQANDAPTTEDLAGQSDEEA